MKNRLSTIIMALVLCLGAQDMLAQQEITITLNVNTADITKRTADANSNFGQRSNISNKDYTTLVKIGDKVTWKGVSTSSSDDRVEIVSINHQGGARLFDKNVLKGSNGAVRAVVSKGKKGDSEKYNVKFHVYRNGQRLSGTFQIDPKLVVRQ